MQFISFLNHFSSDFGLRMMIVGIFAAGMLSIPGQSSAESNGHQLPLRYILFNESSRPHDYPARTGPKPVVSQGKQRYCNETEESWVGTGSASLSVALEAPKDKYYTHRVSVLDTFGHRVITKWLGSHLVVKGLHPGSYTVALSLDDGDWYLGATYNLEKAQWVRLNEGEVGTGYSITIPDSTFEEHEISISGTLISSEETLPNLSFELIAVAVEDAKGVVRARTTTNNQGDFSLNLEMPEGEYFILLKPDGYIPQWWHGDPHTAAPPAISITGDVVDKRFQLEQGATITGSVLANSQPIKSSLSIEIIDQDGYIIASEHLSLGDSTYSISGLVSGQYYIKVSSWGSYKTFYYPESEELTEAQTILLTKNELKTIDISVMEKTKDVYEPMEMGTISGELRYLGNPLPIEAGIEFVYEDSTLTDYYWGWVDEGLFLEEVIANKPVKLQIQPYWGYYLMDSWYPESLDKQNASSITVGAGDTESVSIDLQEGGSAGGFVSFQGNPLYDGQTLDCGNSAIVYAFCAQEERFNYARITEASGYRLTGMSPGTYHGYITILTKKNCSSGPGFTRLPEFTVQSGKTTRLPVISMSSGSGSISGTGEFLLGAAICVDESGHLVAWTEVTIEADEPNLKSNFFFVDFRKPSPPKSADKFIISSLAPGNYYVTALQYSSSYDQPRFYWYGSDSITTDNSRPFKLNPPEDAQLISVGEGENVTIDMSSARSGGRAFGTDAGSVIRVHPTGKGMNVTVAVGGRVAPDAELIIHDCRGRLVHRTKITSKNQSISWTNRNGGIPAGTYLCSLRNNGKVLTRRANILK